MLQMGWFDLYMDLFFKENPDLKREFLNSHRITLAVSKGVAEIEDMQQITYPQFQPLLLKQPG